MNWPSEHVFVELCPSSLLCYQTLAPQRFSSDQPAACSAVNQGSCHGWDKCPGLTAYYSLLYRMDESSEHAAKQPGMGTNREWRLGELAEHFDWDGNWLVHMEVMSLLTGTLFRYCNVATSLTSQDGHASSDHLLLGGSLKRKLMLHHNFLSLYQCQLEDVVQFAPLRAFPSGTRRTTLLRNWVVQCWHGASIGLCWFASTITPKPMCPCD